MYVNFMHKENASCRRGCKGVIDPFQIRFANSPYTKTLIDSVRPYLCFFPFKFDNRSFELRNRKMALLIIWIVACESHP